MPVEGQKNLGPWENMRCSVPYLMICYLRLVLLRKSFLPILTLPRCSVPCTLGAWGPKVRRNQSLFHPPSVPVTSTFPGISASSVSCLSVSRQIQASEGQCWPLWVLNSPPPWNLPMVGIVHYFMHWAAHCRRWGDQDSLRGKWIRISCKGLSYLQILWDPLWGGPLTYTVLGENHCYHWKVSLSGERGPCEQLRGRGKAASYSPGCCSSCSYTPAATWLETKISRNTTGPHLI